MTDSLRKAAFLALFGLLMTPAVAPAGLPDPSHCVVPEYIDIVGSSAQIAMVGDADRVGVMGSKSACTYATDPYGTFTVIVKDASDDPLADVPVTVTINCSLVTICAPGPTPEGVTQEQSCGASPKKYVKATTDEDGIATFCIAGAGTYTGGIPPPCPNAVKATVYVADAFLIGEPFVTVYDFNGAATNPGVEITDLTVWLQAFGLYQTSQMGYYSIFDCSHANGMDIVDLTKWLNVFGSGASASGCDACGVYCP